MSSANRGKRVQGAARAVAVAGVAGMVAAFAALSWAAWEAGASSAANVPPTPISQTSNLTCSGFAPAGAVWSELKVDPPASGTFTNGTLTVTITSFNGKSFNWSSNIGVDAVYVKAGSGGSNLYVYGGEATSDTALSSPGDTGNAISHISFCYDLGGPTSTPTATNTSTNTPTTATNTPTTATNTPTTATSTPTEENDDNDTPTRTSTAAASTGVPSATSTIVNITLGSEATPRTGVTLPSTGSGGERSSNPREAMLLGGAALASLLGFAVLRGARRDKAARR